MVGCYILHFRTRTMHSYREKMQRQCLLISKVYLRLTNHLLPINYVFRITNGHYWRFGAPFIFVRKPISRILVGPLTGIVVRILSMDWGIAAPATAVEICWEQTLVASTSMVVRCLSWLGMHLLCRGSTKRIKRDLVRLNHCSYLHRALLI